MDVNNGKHFNKRATFGQQLMALFKRNVLIKRRNRGRTIMEIIFPIYMVLIVILLKSSMKPIASVAIEYPQGLGTNRFFQNSDSPLFPDFRNTEWFIVSENNSSEIEICIKEVLIQMGYPENEKINFNETFKTSNEIEEYYLSNNKNVKLAIVFDVRNLKNISYTIRMPYESVPNDLNSRGSIGNCRDNPFTNFCDEMKYYRSGFTFIQTVIDSAMIKFLLPETLKDENSCIPETKLYTFPKPEYINDNKLWLSFVPTYLSWSFMPLVSILTVMFVLEKERKIKEGMLLMGLRISAYWLSWILIQAIIVLFISIIVTTVIYFAKIIDNINPLVIFLLLFLFGISMIGVSALISPFFKKEKVAGSFVSFFTLIAGLMHLLVIFFNIPSAIYYLLAFLSPVAFTLAINSITRRTIEINSYVDFNNLFEDTNFSIGTALLMLFFDCFLYALLAIYLDQVIPGEFGPKQSFLFCFNKSYWISPRIAKLNRYSLNEDIVNQENSDVEEVSDDIKRKEAINIRSITKSFGKGKKRTIAVNDLSLSVYESQITGILGHNGAGKTTLINMLVGSISSTSGTAYIYGYDISDPTDMNILRSMFGVCLQQDILFDDLNAEEHLNFFGAMKGIENKNLNSEVIKLLTEVQLFDNRLTPSKNLSGGQKRKLCIAIALIGSPKIILLDEPTSGVDAYSRRQLWTLLQSYKKDRVIILTTHFMDEADVLSDRKAIISKGKLRCVGSSLFLKNRFGIGYHLTVDIKKGTNVDFVNSLVVSKISDAKLNRFTASEVYYILPRTQTQLFPELFKALEDCISDKKSYIKSFGISMTSLEEVFLKIGEEFEIEDHKKQLYSTYESDSIKIDSIISGSEKLKPSFWKSFFAFLYLRLLIFIRNPMHILPIIVLPIIMIAVSYGLMKTNDVIVTKPNPLLLNPTIYEKMRVLKYRFWNTSSAQNDTFISLVNQSGVEPQFIDEFDLKSLDYSYMASNITSFDENPLFIQWDFLFNDTYFHSLPILQNLMTNVYLKIILKSKNISETEKTSNAINTYNHPFPQTIEENNLYSFDAKVYTYVILMAIMLGSIPPAIAVEVVEDREAKIKDLLRVCGLTFKAYWFTTLVCHLIMFSISSFVILIATIFVLKLEFLQYTGAVICIIILFILFMPSSLLACYVLSHIFNKRDTARSILPLICYLPGMIMIIFVSIISSYDYQTGTILHQIFCFIFPFYVPQGCLFWIATTSHLKKISDSLNQNQEFSYFDWDKNITICFIALIFHLLLFTILLPFVDLLKSGQNIFEAIGFKKLTQTHNNVELSSLEDEDVIQERIEVQQFLTNGYRSKNPILLVNDLRKEYSKSSLVKICKKDDQSVKVAINNLSLLVESGNIFGLLGPNGAGKTTAIKIMICDEKQTQGMVSIDGKKVKSSISSIFQLIGYCPQEDALWKEITLREHLQLYASIRGIPSNNINSICSKYLEDLRISEHSDKKTEDLSGGTKRKLCYLISLLGRPKLVFLDEPSTGMDPQSKRFLWKTILTVFQRNSDKSAVLTTHSMEEADALCSRIAIMVKGVMRCIGSVQHLKNKYGAGYMLEIKWNQSNEDIDSHKLKQLISSLFIEAVVKEEYENRLIFSVPQNSVKSLSHIFSFLENSRKTMNGIEEYSFSQTTLEQVFIGFAKEQEQIN